MRLGRLLVVVALVGLKAAANHSTEGPIRPRIDSTYSRAENTLKTPVHVLGDATYAVQGNVCGVQGTFCPRAGDIAIADCTPFLPSYVPSVGCVAPSNAVCSTVASVVDSSTASYYACVFPIGGGTRTVDKFASDPIDKTAAPTTPTATHTTTIFAISAACACLALVIVVFVVVNKAKAKRIKSRQAAQARAIVDQALVPPSDDESGLEVILV